MLAMMVWPTNESALPQEERLRHALERSMVELHSPSRRQRHSPQARRRSPLPAPREDSDPELRRALQQSLEDERIRRCATCVSLPHLPECLLQLRLKMTATWSCSECCSNLLRRIAGDVSGWHAVHVSGHQFGYTILKLGSIMMPTYTTSF